LLPLLAEHEALARRSLDPVVVDYIGAGSADEITLGEAEAAWGRLRFRPRVLRDVAHVEVGTTVLGAPVRSPVLVAPTAWHSLVHPDGELAMRRGTAQAGSLMVLSTRSSTPIEAVGRAADGPWWFQSYLMADRDLTADLVDRAARAGAWAIVVTGDTPYVAPKRRVTAPLPLPEAARRANLVGPADPDRPDLEAGSVQDPSMTLSAIGWIAARSSLPVVVKGVLRGDDARACLDAGASAILVSNHGGRQLDRAVATADALAEVVDAVGGRAEVYVDGGVRDGLSTMAALAIGARAVLVGRPALWALAAGGSDAVSDLLVGLSEDLAAAMALAGAANLAALDRQLLR